MRPDRNSLLNPTEPDSGAWRRGVFVVDLRPLQSGTLEVRQIQGPSTLRFR